MVGGDGTMRGAGRFQTQKRNSKCRVAVVPKTIDNDIPLIDRSFGFDTAVTEAKFIDVAASKLEASRASVGVVRLMGRDAGFLAVHASGGAGQCINPIVATRLNDLHAIARRQLDGVP